METSCVAGGEERGIEGGGRARTRGKIKMEVCGVNKGVWGGDYISRWSRENREAGDNIFIRHLKAQSIADP